MTDRINGGNIPYIVSAFLGDIGISIGQVKVDDKSNKITAIPDLLELIDIQDATITIDARGTQEDIVNKTVKKAHGRSELREYFLSIDTSTIADKEKWKTVNVIAYVRVKTMNNDEVTITDNYYIIEYNIDVDRLEEVIREHRNIECGLHWRLDVIMNEDQSRNRVGNSINNLSILRKIVFNLASLDKNFGKVPLKRKLTNYMLDFKCIERLIFEVIPSLSNVNSFS